MKVIKGSEWGKGNKKNSVDRLEDLVYNYVMGKDRRMIEVTRTDGPISENYGIVTYYAERPDINKIKLLVINLWRQPKEGDSYRAIYDAGDYWYNRGTKEPSSEERLILKTEKPMYPLAAIAKWGFRPADGVTEEEIGKLCYEAAEKNKKTL